MFIPLSFPLKPFIFFWKERRCLLQISSYTVFVCAWDYTFLLCTEWTGVGGNVDWRAVCMKREDAFVSFVFPRTSPTASTRLYIYIRHYEYRKKSERELRGGVVNILASYMNSLWFYSRIGSCVLNEGFMWEYSNKIWTVNSSVTDDGAPR